MQTLLRRIGALAGFVAAIPVSFLVAWTIRTPITGSGALYLFGSVVTALGAISAPWRLHRYRGMTRLGLVLLGGTATVRLLFTPYSPTLRLLTLPEFASGRWVNRIFDEQDVALFGARAMSTTGMFLTPHEAVDVVPALHTAYAAMGRTDGRTVSPFLSTYLGWQSANAFDLLVAEAGTASPQTAIIFLHGFTGNFTVQCWLVAEAARAVGAMTLCPSVGWRGDWWSAQGEAVVNTSVGYLRERDIERIYLAGLSNGAVGASVLASGHSDKVAGLILISGADSAAARSGLPVLLLQGREDERMPAALARQVAQQAAGRATYHEFAGDHFLLAKQADAVRKVMVKWLTDQMEAVP